MMQTWAIFLDAYRELHARKLFWLTMVLSGLVVASIGCLGIDEEGVSVIFFKLSRWTTADIPRAAFYKNVFTTWGVAIWLTWGATILGIVSTAGIFPDFVSRGSIDQMLSKPISRFRLFLTKYATGLMFVTAQVTVFCVGSFLVLGFRANLWEFGLFTTIPIIVCFFSYIFAICVAIGMKTRSTITAVLLTVVAHVLIYMADFSETMIANVQLTAERSLAGMERAYERRPSPALQASIDRERESVASIRQTHSILAKTEFLLPKSAETIALVDRALVKLSEVPDDDAMSKLMGSNSSAVNIDDTYETMTRFSPLWIIGTSLIWEALLLLFVGWRFCRMDF